MSFQRIGHKVIWLDEVNSTNEYSTSFTKDSKAHGIVVAAKNQTQGRGQRGNEWESKPGENLLFSIVLKPTFLPVSKQFLLSKITALAVVDFLSDYKAGFTIKWPNDIYIDNRKIAGILIENSFHSENLDTTIVGIGININQSEFSDDLPNPTSLFCETGKRNALGNMLTQFCKLYQEYYSALLRNEVSPISARYFEKLYRRASYGNYTANGQTFRAKIIGVKDTGELVLETESGQLKEFAFKEVSFVI